MNLRWRLAQAAEIRWWNNYLKKKNKADYLLWKKEYWKKLLKETALTFSEEEKILDAGCGPAGIFMALENQQVNALDPLLDRYERDLQHFDKKDYPHVQFFSEALETYSSMESYDKVFCLNAINHVADLDLCFDQLVAMAKEGGDLIVSIDAHNFSFFKKIFQMIPGDILHPHQYDLEEYKKMLTDRGCKIQKIQLIKKEFLFDYFMIIAKK